MIVPNSSPEATALICQEKNRISEINVCCSMMNNDTLALNTALVSHWDITEWVPGHYGLGILKSPSTFYWIHPKVIYVYPQLNITTNIGLLYISELKLFIFLTYIATLQASVFTLSLISLFLARFKNVRLLSWDRAGNNSDHDSRQFPGTKTKYSEIIYFQQLETFDILKRSSFKLYSVPNIMNIPINHWAHSKSLFLRIFAGISLNVKLVHTSFIKICYI